MTFHIYRMGAASFRLKTKIHRLVGTVAVTEEYFLGFTWLDRSERQHLMAGIQPFSPTVRMILFNRVLHGNDIPPDFDALMKFAVEIPQNNGIIEISRPISRIEPQTYTACFTRSHLVERRLTGHTSAYRGNIAYDDSVAPVVPEFKSSCDRTVLFFNCAEVTDSIIKREILRIRHCLSCQKAEQRQHHIFKAEILHFALNNNVNTLIRISVSL